MSRKNQAQAKKLLKGAIEKHPAFLQYKAKLQEAGITTEEIEIDEKVVDQVQDFLKDYDKKLL